MEKIYENKFNNKKNGKIYNFIHSKKGRIVNLTLILVLFAGIVAVAFRNISFAYTETNTNYKLGDSFTIRDYTTGGEEYSVTGRDADGNIIGAEYSHTLFTDSSNPQPVFCLDYYKTLPIDNVTYTKGEEITDFGLLYLTANLYPNATKNGTENTYTHSGGTKITDEKVLAWISQEAIWAYLSLTSQPETLQPETGHTPFDYTKILSYDTATKAITELPTTTAPTLIYTENCSLSFTNTCTPTITSTTNVFAENGIGALIAEAVKIYNNKKVWDENNKDVDSSKYPLFMDVKTVPSTKDVSDDATKLGIAKTSDGTYFQTGEIKVVTTKNDAYKEMTGDVTSYTLTLTEAPSGTKLVDADGKDITEGYDLSTKGFYIRIPVSSVTSKEQTINVDVGAVYPSYTGHYYTTTNTQSEYQKVTTVTTSPRTTKGYFKFTVVGPENTASNNSVIFIIIGLVVLVSGLGIIYANIKPRHE